MTISPPWHPPAPSSFYPKIYQCPLSPLPALTSPATPLSSPHHHKPFLLFRPLVSSPLTSPYPLSPLPSTACSPLPSLTPHFPSSFTSPHHACPSFLVPSEHPPTPPSLIPISPDFPMPSEHMVSTRSTQVGKWHVRGAKVSPGRGKWRRLLAVNLFLIYLLPCFLLPCLLFLFIYCIPSFSFFITYSLFPYPSLSAVNLFLGVIYLFLPRFFFIFIYFIIPSSSSFLIHIPCFLILPFWLLAFLLLIFFSFFGDLFVPSSIFAPIYILHNFFLFFFLFYHILLVSLPSPYDCYPSCR